MAQLIIRFLQVVKQNVYKINCSFVTVPNTTAHLDSILMVIEYNKIITIQFLKYF